MKSLHCSAWLAALFVAGCGFAPKTYFGAGALKFEGENQIDTLRELNATAMARAERDLSLANVEPFREIECFDDDAKSWSNIFCMMDGDGVLAFDANGDGRIDVYTVQDGQNWTRPCDADGVLLDKPRFQSNMLYLNQGNDEKGDPVFKSVKELTKANATHQADELLIEDYLFPRQSADDSTERYGRQSTVAVAADFNADGRPDILVGNKPTGMVWSDPQTRGIQTQFIDPIGRQVRDSAAPLTPLGQSLVNFEPRYSLDDKRVSSRGEEYEGANSLFLNMGDEDGDGIPEWKDVSREAGIEGKRPTTQLTVADFDRDGDLDVFEANRMDEDCWVGNSNKLAGAANCLYQNQLVETGKLTFTEIGGKANVDGLYDDDNPEPDYYKVKHYPLLPDWASLLIMSVETFKPDYITVGGAKCEPGQITWCSVEQDLNDDGLPDLWVGDDMGQLTLFMNKGGMKFEKSPHARSSRGGNWMSFAAGDYDNDQKEDMFCGNSGGAIINASMATFPIKYVFDPPIMISVALAQFLVDKHDPGHALISGADWMKELDVWVDHSVVLPPDTVIPTNIEHPIYKKMHEQGLFDINTLDPYEFAWGSTPIDVQNDGKLDVYWVGGLAARGGFIMAMGLNPGRLLVNHSDEPHKVRFADETAEHHVFNIQEMHYETLATEGYIWRPAPTQSWSKRDVVYNYDRSVWMSNGPMINERVVNQDMLQCAENGRAALATDLNGDGFEDLIVRNKGGYDSRSSKAKNLMVKIDGKNQVLPAHHNSYPAPTTYEPGSTRVFINQYHGNHWLKVKLVDDSGWPNKDAIGAEATIDSKHLMVMRAGSGSFVSNVLQPLHFGLGGDAAHRIEITWPDQERTRQTIDLGGIADQTVTISKTKGILR